MRLIPIAVILLSLHVSARAEIWSEGKDQELHFQDALLRCPIARRHERRPKRRQPSWLLTYRDSLERQDLQGSAKDLQRW